jgi:hypothetical protein
MNNAETHPVIAYRTILGDDSFVFARMGEKERIAHIAKPELVGWVFPLAALALSVGFGCGPIPSVALYAVRVAIR